MGTQKGLSSTFLFVSYHYFKTFVLSFIVMLNLLCVWIGHLYILFCATPYHKSHCTSLGYKTCILVAHDLYWGGAVAW